MYLQWCIAFTSYYTPLLICINEMKYIYKWCWCWTTVGYCTIRPIMSYSIYIQCMYLLHTNIFLSCIKYCYLYYILNVLIKLYYQPTINCWNWMAVGDQTFALLFILLCQLWFYFLKECHHFYINMANVYINSLAIDYNKNRY